MSPSRYTSWANREPLRVPNEHSSRTCTAGTIVLTSVRCSLAEVDTTLLKQ